MDQPRDEGAVLEKKSLLDRSREPTMRYPTQPAEKPTSKFDKAEYKRWSETVRASNLASSGS